MAKKTYILEIVYDDEAGDILDFHELIEVELKRFVVNNIDIGIFFDKETTDKLEEVTDIGIS